MGMHFLERWLICVERFTNADFLTAEGEPPGSGVLDDITRCPSFKVERFLQHTHWRFLSVLHTMFSTTSAQTISMLAPKAQECLVTIMLHMANRAKKNKPSAPPAAKSTESAKNLSTASTVPTTSTTASATANSLAAVLQTAAGFNSMPVCSSSSSEQLMAAMEAAMSISSTNSPSHTAPTASSAPEAASSEQREEPAEPESTGAPPAAPSGSAANESAPVVVSGAEAAAAPVNPEEGAASNSISDELAHLMDMFPTVPRELVMSALVECHGDLQVSVLCFV